MVAVHLDNDGETQMPYLLSEEDWIEVKTQIARTLEAPVEAHTEIGAVSYYLNGSLIRNYPIVTDKEVRECTYGFICRYIMNLYLM